MKTTSISLKLVLLACIFNVGHVFAKVTQAPFGNNFSHINSSMDDVCPKDPKGNVAYSFKNQDQVDSFKTDYPDCDVIPYLTIKGDNISNLDGLSNIKAVEHDVDIGPGNFGLVSLSGLNNLLYVYGDINISNNVSLTNINGFQRLYGVRHLNILNNSKLAQITAMPNLWSVKAGIAIISSENLTAINGTFSSLSVIGQDFSGDDGDGLTIGDTSLTSLKAFSQLRDVTRLYLDRNISLKSLDGLQNIVKIIDYPSPVVTRIFLLRNFNLSECSQLSQIYKKYPGAFSSFDGLNPLCQASIRN